MGNDGLSALAAIHNFLVWALRDRHVGILRGWLFDREFPAFATPPEREHVDDATDRAGVQELIILGELVDKAREAGVQTIVEGPGHIPLNEIAANVMVQKKLATTPKQARQMITHKRVKINGRIVNSPGYLIPTLEENSIEVKMKLKKPKQSSEDPVTTPQPEVLSEEDLEEAEEEGE